MKKIKDFCIAIILLMLCLFCMCNPTFSWFTPSENNKGISFMWDNNSTGSDNSFSFDITKGDNISMCTYYSADGKDYGETPVNSFSTDSSSAILGGNRNYYRTDITNANSTNAQNVSLYMSSLSIADTATGKFFLGLSSPLKTYKQYGLEDEAEENSKLSRSKMRVYFQPNNHTNWTGTAYTVCYNVNNEEPDGTSYVNMTATPTTGTYYADIPSNTKRMYFKVTGSTENYKRTQTFTDVQGDGVAPNQSYVFSHSGNYDSGGYNNAQASKEKANGANFINCYESINISTSNAFELSLIANTDYIGSITSYSSSNTAIFTVNANGVITPIKAGSATLSISVKGSKFNDTQTVTIPVNITADSDANESIPIITNLKIPANDTVSVYWYIKNDAEQSTTLYYNIDGLYLSL